MFVTSVMFFYQITLILVLTGAGACLSNFSNSCRSPDLLNLNYKDSRPVGAPDAIYLTSKGVTVCSRGYCGDISTVDMLCAYPFTFTTIKEYTKKTGTDFYKRIALTSEQFQMDKAADGTQSSDEFARYPEGDGDHCCPTHIYATYYTERMNNLNDESCIIINLSRNFQMVTEGICGPFEASNCNSCQQMYTAHSLLAWNTVTHNFRFEMFNIPTYCACINGS